MSKRKQNAPESSLNVVSLFSGAGGLDLGLAAAGFSIRYETDVDPFSCSTLEANGPKAERFGLNGFESTVVREADIRSVKGDEIRESSGLASSEVHVLAGGPPCQAFSVFGKRKGVGDDRGKLIFEYARVLAELKPVSFIFENVYGLLSIQGGEVFEEILRTLEEPSPGIRYVVDWDRVNAMDFQVPQSRDRVIVCGVREDHDTKGSFRFKVNSDLHKSVQSLPMRTARDGLSDLPPASRTASKLSNHFGRKHGHVVTERYKNLSYGERDGKTRINRLDPDRPSFTIVVGSDAGGGKGHVHPDEPRELTPRESARLQTFPDWWSFTGNVRHSIRQVGNAVPCLLGFAIGNALRSTVFDREPISLAKGIESLSQEHLYKRDEKRALSA